MPTYLIRVPDHLGDGVMAMPAVAAIAKLGPTSVSGPSWATRLYGLENVPLRPADVAVLLKPSFSAAWVHRHYSRRCGHVGDWRRWLLTDPVERSGGHRTTTYGDVAKALGASVSGEPAFTPTDRERERAPVLPESAVLLLPLSRSQATVGWPSYRALADRLGGRAVFAAGPNECKALSAIAGPHPCLPPLPVGEFAVVASAAAAVVANDSGLAHLSQASRRAAGREPSSLHVIFGSTSPQVTGPSGCSPHRLNHLPCAPCYRKACSIGQAQPPCLDVSVDAVLRAVA